MFKKAIAQVGNNYRRNANRVLRNGVFAFDQLVNSLLYPQQPLGLQLAGVNNFDLYNKSVFPQEIPARFWSHPVRCTKEQNFEVEETYQECHEAKVAAYETLSNL